MKIRVKYTKTGALRFIGHLDIMRFFQKVISRANIDIAFSEGFSPHQIISFAAPLGLGVTSEGEYFDAEVKSLISTTEYIKKFNEQTVDGIKILNVVLLPDTAKNSMSSVAGSDYLITIKENYYNTDNILSMISSFNELDKIEILKKTKKSEEMVNIKPLIFDLHVENKKIYMKLSTGSANNLKPELVMEALLKFSGLKYDKLGFSVHRLETYTLDENNSLISLCDVGKVIE